MGRIVAKKAALRTNKKRGVQSVGLPKTKGCDMGKKPKNYSQLSGLYSQFRDTLICSQYTSPMAFAQSEHGRKASRMFSDGMAAHDVIRQLHAG